MQTLSLVQEVKEIKNSGKKSSSHNKLCVQTLAKREKEIS